MVRSGERRSRSGVGELVQLAVAGRQGLDVDAQLPRPLLHPLFEVVGQLELLLASRRSVTSTTVPT